MKNNQRDSSFALYSFTQVRSQICWINRGERSSDGEVLVYSCVHGCLDPQEKGELCSVLCKRELNSKERKWLGSISLPAVTAARKLQALIYILPQSTTITDHAIGLEKLSIKGQLIVGA